MKVNSVSGDGEVLNKYVTNRTISPKKEDRSATNMPWKGPQIVEWYHFYSQDMNLNTNWSSSVLLSSQQARN